MADFPRTRTPVVSMSVDDDRIKDLLEQISSEASAGKFNLAIQSGRHLLSELNGAKASITVFNNTIRSVSEGINAGAITKKQGTLEVKDAIFNLRLAVFNIIDGLRNPKPTSFEEELAKDLSRDPLRVYDKDMNAIQTRLNRDGVFTGYVPVLPLSSPPLDAAKLNRVGISATRFAGYTILNKQFVAGLSMDYIRAHTAIPGEKGGPDRRPLKDDKAAQALIEEFRETILSKYRSLKLAEMYGEPRGWWGGLWFWFAPQSEFKLMHGCTINETTVSSLKFRKWDFPFAK